MDQYLPLITAFLLTLAIFALLFGAIWSLWTGPRRIRSAVAHRYGPLRLRAAVRTTVVYWLLVALLAVAVAGGVAYLCWAYLGSWLYLYQSSEDWHARLAAALNRTFWGLRSEVGDSGYYQFLPLDLIICALLGVVAGVWLGTWLGRLAAAKRFFITRKMF